MHVLGFAAADGRVGALARDEATGAVSRVALDGPFAWRVHPVRRCVGRFDDVARHLPCPTAEPVSLHRQCPACSGLDDEACVFEPRCLADPAACTCVTTFKGVPHVVYLAFHGTLPKVGLTTRRRLERRLWEQGADAYLVVQECPDRAVARAVEQQVSYVHKVPEHRGHRETLPQLARPVPWPQIEARAAEVRARLAPHYPVAGALHRVQGHPIEQPLASAPRRVPSEGLHRGTWLGAKGNHLVYRPATGGGLAAFKLSDLVGRRIDVGTAAADDADAR